jgi:uncharacterized membrane protein
LGSLAIVSLTNVKSLVSLSCNYQNHQFHNSVTNQNLYKAEELQGVMKKKEIILLLGGIAFIALVISLSLLLGNHLEVKTCGCPKMISQNFIWLFITLAIIFVVSLLYYLFSLKIEEKERCLCKNMEILNSILDKDEKKVIDKIASNKGEMEQSKISEV